MMNLRSAIVSLPPVEALRTEKWRRRAAADLFPKAKVRAAEADGGKKRALIEARMKRDTSVPEWRNGLINAGCSPQAAEDMLWCRLAYGFSFSEYRCYCFEDKTIGERLAFFSDRESVMLSYRINDLDGMDLFSDKGKTWRRFAPFYGRDAVCLRSSGDLAALTSFLEKHPTAIVKPASGSCGTGVRMIDASGQDLRGLSAELLSAGPVLLEEPIAQSVAMASFHPASVNTVRVVTFCGKTGVRPLWAFLKTGRGGSLTDNGAAGGIMAGIGLADGRVCTDGIDETGRRYSVHPDSGKPFSGFDLPDWEALKATCVSAAVSVPEVRMIGWDAAHTDGGWRIVEGNAQSELIGPQAVSGRGLRREIMGLLEELRLPTGEYRA